MYNTFAYYYDILMSDFDYEMFHRFCKKYVKGTILDIGCGTGVVTSKLQKDNFEIVGADYSSDMLLIARDRNPNIEYFTFDMSKDYLPISTYDSIISIVDSVSYLITEEDLIHFFTEVYSSLNDGGVFLFDFHTISKLLQFENHEEYDEYDDFSYSFSCTTNNNIVTHDIEIFTPQSYFEEKHYQRCFEDQYIIDLLVKLGFKVEKEEEYSDEFRTFVVCRK